MLHASAQYGADHTLTNVPWNGSGISHRQSARQPPSVFAVSPVRSDLPNLWPKDLVDEAVKQAVADLHARRRAHV